MTTAIEVLRWANGAVFTGLGVIAMARWKTRRGVARAWVAATFGDLAVVELAGLLLPPVATTSAEMFANRLLIALLVVFPYLLYRFGITFLPIPRVWDRAAAILTAALVVGIFFVGRLPAPGERWSTRLGVYIALLVVQWVSLLGCVAVLLWRGGHGQPTVARRRMRIMSAGAIGLAAALLLSASTSGHTSAALATSALSMACAPLFLVGFAPPRALLATWRRPEIDELRRAEAGLVEAMTVGEVASQLVPRVRRIVGGSGAAMFDESGEPLTVDGLSQDQARQFGAVARGDRPASADLLLLPLRAGTLVVQASVYTPYFGREDAALVRDLAVLADLAISRARVAEVERQTAAELHAANRAMTEFVAIASHDLRTPITVIRGFSAMLQQEGFDERQRQEFAASISRQIERLSRLVDDLLLSSRIDAGALEPAATDFDLRPLIGQITDDLGPVAGDLILDVPHATVCHADPDHATRILSNLLQNAFAYGTPPVQVTATTPGGGAVEIRVIDAGAGLPPEFVGRAFERFARVDKVASKARNGTGLGLAIVRGLARSEGGDAWYEPMSDGACFVVRLPAGRSA